MKANTGCGRNGIIHAMNNRAKSALALALAIVGGIAAGMRCDASVTVETPTQINPRVAAYTVKTYTEGSDPFDARIWIIDEYSNPAYGGLAGKWLLVDGFVIGGTTYKVDGSTCVKIKCAVNYYSIETCVNLIASGIGKQPPYIVPPGEFGGPPKEPRDGEEPPYVR